MIRPFIFASLLSCFWWALFAAGNLFRALADTLLAIRSAKPTPQTKLKFGLL